MKVIYDNVIPVNDLTVLLDGLLTMSDIRAYFRSVGRPSNDSALRQWIRERDVDQDGAVSLTEFVFSYVHQLDPSADFDKNAVVSTSKSPSAIAIAFGNLRLGASAPECLEAVVATEEYVQRILDAPSSTTYLRIPKADANYKSKIGRLFGGDKMLEGNL